MYKINEGIQFLESKISNLQIYFNDTKKKNQLINLFFFFFNKKINDPHALSLFGGVSK